MKLSTELRNVVMGKITDEQRKNAQEHAYVHTNLRASGDLLKIDLLPENIAFDISEGEYTGGSKLTVFLAPELDPVDACRLKIAPNDIDDLNIGLASNGLNISLMIDANLVIDHGDGASESIIRLASESKIQVVG